MTDSPVIHSIRKNAGVAGQFSVTATVEYPDEESRTLEFVGSVYGGPVVMRCENGAEMFVTAPERFGAFNTNGVAWVRRFMEAS